jgi:multiple sugar transport system permease protein
MPILPAVATKHWKVRVVSSWIYIVLTILGISMVIPFLMTISGALSDEMDYYRHRPVPRYLYSRSDLFVKRLTQFLPSQMCNWGGHFKAYFPSRSAHWANWEMVGRDVRGIDEFASPWMGENDEPMRLRAADYFEFMMSYPIDDMILPVVDADAAKFLATRYTQIASETAGGAKVTRDQALEAMNAAWGVPYPDFHALNFESERRMPLDQQSFFPTKSTRLDDFRIIGQAYLMHEYTPGVRDAWLKHVSKALPQFAAQAWPMSKQSPEQLRSEWIAFCGQYAPAPRALPFAMRAIWRSFLSSEVVRQELNLPPSANFDVTLYNQLSGQNCATLDEIPFPLPADEAPPIQSLWKKFVENRYPLRLTSVAVTPELQNTYKNFLETRFKTITIANQMLNTTNSAWEQFEIVSTHPGGPQGALWSDFVKRLPLDRRQITSSEHAYQQFLLGKYGNLETVNQKYNWNLRCIEQAFPPFADAYAVSFSNLSSAWRWDAMTVNFVYVFDYFVHRGRAVPVTLVLICATLLTTLTVNPIAAYGLSRFHIRGMDKVILYLLVPMAFPGMVSAIPAYLLMRDLSLLNTFWALVLPGAASGMSIFMLKGFFDSLPRELYEAATIDGASEARIFLVITLPLMKPILAIQCLGAFMWAYTSWDWAMIVCQDQSMWTLSVWMYQASTSFMPWTAMAGFVLTSIPTLMVFLFCQRIILRGIILPSMK